MINWSWIQKSPNLYKIILRPECSHLINDSNLHSTSTFFLLMNSSSFKLSHCFISSLLQFVAGWQSVPRRPTAPPSWLHNIDYRFKLPVAPRLPTFREVLQNDCAFGHQESCKALIELMNLQALPLQLSVSQFMWKIRRMADAGLNCSTVYIENSSLSVGET